MAPKTASMAQKASILAGFMYIVIGVIPVLLGIFGRVAMPENTGESILIDLAQKYLPMPLMALMIGALLSAIMSSADSALLAPAGIIGHNIVSYFRPGASEKTQLRWCHRSILIVGILSLIMALYFQNIYALCMHAWGILLVGVAAPMIFGVLWKGATTPGAVCGAICGTVSWIVLSFWFPEGYPTHLFGFIISAIVLILISFFTKKKHQNFQAA
jgi:Na+/proline symporter